MCPRVGRLDDFNDRNRPPMGWIDGHTTPPVWSLHHSAQAKSRLAGTTTLPTNRPSPVVRGHEKSPPRQNDKAGSAFARPETRVVSRSQGSIPGFPTADGAAGGAQDSEHCPDNDQDDPNRLENRDAEHETQHQQNDSQNDHVDASLRRVLTSSGTCKGCCTDHLNSSPCSPLAW